jgi:hypothetical protein
MWCAGKVSHKTHRRRLVQSDHTGAGFADTDRRRLQALERHAIRPVSMVAACGGGGVVGAVRGVSRERVPAMVQNDREPVVFLKRIEVFAASLFLPISV